MNLRSASVAGFGGGASGSNGAAGSANANATVQPVAVPPGVVPTFTAHATDLAALLAFDQKSVPDATVPIIITKCCRRLFETGLSTEGIFRVPGNSNRLAKAENEFNLGKGAQVDFKKMGISVEDAASLLKKFLRESLNDTLFPSAMQNEFAGLGQLGDMASRNAAFLKLWSKLPQINRAVLAEVLELLVNVAANSFLNLMNTDNLGTVFGGMADIPMKGGKWILVYLLEEYEQLFGAPSCLNSSGPVIRRKLVNHNKSIFCLGLVNNTHVISADGQGTLNVWKTDDYSLVKKMTCDTNTYVSQVFVNIESAQIQQFWTLFPHYIRIWDLSTSILAPNTKKLEECPSHTIQLPNACFAALVGETMWISGDKVVVIDAITHGIVKELPEYQLAVAGSPVPVLGYACNYIWIWSGKTVHVWNTETYTKVREITIDGFSAPKSSKIFGHENKVWMSTDNGSFIIIDVDGFEIKQVVTGHSAAVYHIQTVGSLTWSCSWDTTIVWWKSSPTVEVVYKMPNRHSDAISYLLPVWREELNGWDVWSASWDRSCQVTFVPASYAENIPAQTPQSATNGIDKVAGARAVSATSLLAAANAPPLHTQSSPSLAAPARPTSPTPSNTNPPTGNFIPAGPSGASSPLNAPLAPSNGGWGRPQPPTALLNAGGGFQFAFATTSPATGFGSAAAPSSTAQTTNSAPLIPSGLPPAVPLTISPSNSFESLSLAQMEGQVKELEAKLAQMALMHDRELDGRMAVWSNPPDAKSASELKNFIKAANEAEVEVQLKIEELRLRIRGELHAQRYSLIFSRLSGN